MGIERSNGGDDLERSLTLPDSTLLIVASVIGSGIFFTPGVVADLLPRPEWIAVAWICGGLISLAGALAFGELGAMYPHAGGDYVYLREGAHPAAGFLVGWLTFFAIYAGTIAALAAALAEGLAGYFGLAATLVPLLAVAVTLAVSALNYVGVRWGARANNVTSILKIAALAVFGLAGPMFGEGDWSRLSMVSSDAAPAATFSLANFGLALSPILFTFLGWNASVYVAGEIRDPERNVPRSLVLGLAICTVVYLLLNAVYLYALPMEQLRGVSNAAEASAQALFGGIGGRLLGGFVLVSILGTLNAMVLVGPRIAYAMGRDEMFFGNMARVSPRFGTPGAAIAMQAGVVVILIAVFRTFLSAVNFTTFAILLATIADVVVLYRLRRLRPELPRPYRAWGYPVVPAIYLLANAGIAVSLLIGRPFECVISLLMLAAGVPFYAYFRRRH